MFEKEYKSSFPVTLSAHMLYGSIKIQPLKLNNTIISNSQCLQTFSVVMHCYTLLCIQSFCIKDFHYNVYPFNEDLLLISYHVFTPVWYSTCNLSEENWSILVSCMSIVCPILHIMKLRFLC